MKTRREILKFVSALSGSMVLHGWPLSLAWASGPRGEVENEKSGGPIYHTDATKIQERWDAALAGLRKNVAARAYRFAQSVLLEGDRYRGIWLEDGPHEGLIYAPFDPAVAANCHRLFFQLQRADGYLPYCVRFDRIESSQIQMVVPIAATALELSDQLQEEEFLVQAYNVCAAWDQWLVRYRNTRGTGLCEAFCGYDTGHDNSPRFNGIPWKCPKNDARLCPRIPGMPRLAPDLSATVYGGRSALAKMAQKLGRETESAQWLEKAEAIRAAIMKWCFDPDTSCFYDLDAHNGFVKVRGDALSRVVGEHVVDAKLFEEIYRRHIHNPNEFWTPFPFPSIAADDPLFDHNLPLNSWGGAAQALTAMRAPRWMEYYGKPADLAHVMAQWVRALVRGGAFQQQMNPWTGELSTGSEYSPAMLVLLDFVARLHGIRRAGENFEWNCRLPDGATVSRFALPTPRGLAELVTRRRTPVSGDSAPHRVTEIESELVLGGKKCLKVHGTARVETNERGVPMAVVGTEPDTCDVTLTQPGGQSVSAIVRANQRLAIDMSGASLGRKARIELVYIRKSRNEKGIASPALDPRHARIGEF